MKFDDILLVIGEFGPYQNRIFFLTCLPILIAGAQVFSVILIYDIPAHRCALPGYPDDTYKIQNEAHARLVNLSIPPAEAHDDGVYSGCLIYSITNTSRMLESAVHANKTEECHRRVYDKSDFVNTVITEFDLVCGQEIMRSHANLVGFFGSLCGSLVMGIFADVFGRKKAILLSLLLEIVSSLMTFFAQSFYVIMMARLIGGVATIALFAIPATAGIELVGPNKRSLAGVIVEFCWFCGVLLALPAAYAMRQWRYTQLIIMIVATPMLALWCLVPESPRWLLGKGHYAQAETIVKTICRSNNEKFPIGALNQDPQDKEPKMKFWAMFTHKVLILRSLIVFFNWMAVYFLYYGLSLYTTNLDGSPYLNYLFTAMIELSAYTFCLPVMNRVGRRKFHCVCMFIGSLACLGVVPTVLFGAHDSVRTSMALAGKFCASCSYAILYILSAEQFPTVLRNSAIGFCAFFQSLGGMCAHYIADLGILLGGSLGKATPMVVFGGISLLAGGLSLLLPETLHRRLPETIEDALNVGRDDVPITRNGYQRTPVSIQEIETSTKC